MTIKQVNLHYVVNGKRVCTSLRTVLDTANGKKKYYIEEKETASSREVTKEEGNVWFLKMCQEHPEMKSLIVVDYQHGEFSYKNTNGHYEVKINDDSYCTCDTAQEACEEIAALKAMM